MRGKKLLLAIFMGILLPSLLFAVGEKIWTKKDRPPVQETTEQIQEQTESLEASSIEIYVLQSDETISKMKLETYLVGVVLGEMPLSFDLEALKAQAVVARTYTLRRATISPKHEAGAVCVNAACCQAYCIPDTYGNDVALDKAVLAVSETAGQVVTYNGALIEATYFSCSGGRTEDAVAVWGKEVPYLRSVDSPGEESAIHYTDTVQFMGTEFARLLGLSLKGDPAKWLGAVTYTDGDGVATMVIGGTVFKGTELRQKLGLSSTAFTVEVVGDVVKIVTKGFGHRVGMSQYGAEAMAVKGNSYRDILAYYYPGTSLDNDYRN